MKSQALKEFMKDAPKRRLVHHWIKEETLEAADKEVRIKDPKTGKKKTWSECIETALDLLVEQVRASKRKK